MHKTIPNTEVIQNLQQVRHWIWPTVQDGLRGPEMVREEAGLRSPMREEVHKTYAWLKFLIKSRLLLAFALHRLVSLRRAPYWVPLAIMFG